MEQEEYVKEGIDWKEIKFVDNQPLLVRISSHDNGVYLSSTFTLFLKSKFKVTTFNYLTLYLSICKNLWTNFN